MGPSGCPPYVMTMQARIRRIPTFNSLPSRVVRASVTVFEATENGLMPLECRVRDGQALLTVDSPESGWVVVWRQ